jgi:formylglycine-generating enzyme required for sulfatase activity
MTNPPIPDEEAANRLFVEAVLLWNRAEGQPIEQRPEILQRVQSNLWTIIKRHSGSTLAVRLVIGETVGPLSVRRVEAAVVDAMKFAYACDFARAAVEAAVVDAHARAAAEAEAGGSMLDVLKFTYACNLARAAGVVASFRDCPECPEMVVIPAGITRLASGRGFAIAAPFALGKFEVTFEEWDACVAQGGCSHRPYDMGWGRGRRPVINVSWHDAQDYVAWLSKRTGQAYRLPSEAEWEYAAQADTRREARVTPGAGQANCNGCGSRWDNKQTAPVGRFLANAFGLHDMLGNVWEWTADCWNKTHSVAPRDGTARTDGDCSRRVLRGGSWHGDPEFTRSADRGRSASGNRLDSIGFRVASTL